MDQATLTTLLISGVIFLSGFVQSTIGFGYAIVALSIFSYFLDLREANVIVALSIQAPLLFAVWSYRRELKLTTLLLCVAGAAVGLPIGVWIFNVIDEVTLIRLTGGLIFLLALEGLLVTREIALKTTVSWFWATFAGAASGLLAGAVGMGGPPVVTYASRQRWSPREIKVFLLAFFLLQGLLRIGGLAASGWIDRSNLRQSAVATVFALLGTWLGLRVSHNIDAKWFRRLTLGSLIVLSLGMVAHPAKEVTPARPAELPAAIPAAQSAMRQK